MSAKSDKGDSFSSEEILTSKNQSSRQLAVDVTSEEMDFASSKIKL